ncbi:MULTISPECIES: aldo/keto reductase [unclassified Mycolicibacterium]|uniref:aldo/keto reductase n=1 Tax=unclassified Mycolicibacterium TaxID=2636767 RepID=UPI0012DEE391|nr:MULTISPECIES: aldo/keto reductase [unclassified Mycolicibacterium]MUL80573.1 aldo/keto reductase [Mycolicibacterium sp. CBMA 329]MUL86340.1 aldo/keto reductase [Mycolicibacterium sp. CBMA 331]MUM03083.1 aldo/keto reductase [Mycolicibacterium sp. CBMA 334]MUM26868.1 aldo/keto reductase [Mycolicibacterium sp. CBMA 295]MUM36636.1 aldo/keto reductase [Mycolicibacterium sp. CBMA 247]
MTSSAGSAIPTVTLNDDRTIPVVGLGVGGLSDSEAERAVSAALEAGYRLIDTAAAYGNEAGVGRAIAASGIPREEISVTTKLDIADQGFQSSQNAGRASLERLGLDYVDLYLIHWPGVDIGKYVDSWGGLMALKQDGLARSTGVANFSPEHLSTIVGLTFVTPAVNQIELHPLLNQSAWRAANAEYNVTTEAYSPLGVGSLLDNPAVTAIADAHGRTPAQVLIRWSIQLGNVVISRSANPERIASNLDVFGFELTAEQMDNLSGLDDGTRFRPDPATYTG